MAWAEKLPSGRWRGVYRDRAGKRRSAGTFTHKPKAVREAGKLESDSRRPGWRDPDRALMTWGEWCDQWWPSRPVEPGTSSRDESRRDNHVLPRWRDVALADVNRQDIRAWAAELRASGRSAATVQRIVHLLSASLTAAVDAEVLPVNPAYRLKLPGGGAKGSERYLTTDEYDAIRAELEEDEALVADVLVNTGMRWGEAAGLHWHRVDLRRRQVRVAEVYDVKEHRVKAYPKGRKLRDVPLPDSLCERLRELDVPTGTCPLPHAEGRCRAPLVLPNSVGGVLDDSKFRKAFMAAAKRAKVGHVRVHDLRHTYASWLIQDGVLLEEVGRLLGHVSVQTTQRYAHLVEHPSHDDVRAALDGRRGATRGAGETTTARTTAHKRETGT